MSEICGNEHVLYHEVSEIRQRSFIVLFVNICQYIYLRFSEYFNEQSDMPSVKKLSDHKQVCPMDPIDRTIQPAMHTAGPD